jgi:hypothetical protein
MAYGDPSYTLFSSGSFAVAGSVVGAIFGSYGGLSTISAETVHLWLSAEGARSYRIGPSATLTNGTGYKIPGGASDVVLPPIRAHELKDYGIVNSIADVNASALWAIWRRYP